MTPAVALVKLPFIFADAMWMKITSTPPNPPLPYKDHIVPDWRERFLKSLALPSVWLRMMYWAAGMIEMLVIIASVSPQSPVSRIVIKTLVSNPASVHQLAISPFFVLGNLCTCYGAILRLRCYRTLGKLFSFELCIHQDHVLVESGPYAIVRHPSYTGLILTILGAYLNNLQGSWVRECGLLENMIGRGMVAAWITISLAVILSLLLRISREDEILRGKFGEEWVSWSKRVPYRLVPLVY